jgi:hypothetical protein
MTDYIYSRVSTDEQSTAGQITSLVAKYPNARIVSETASGAKSRPILTRLIAELVAGDRLIVAALDRLGRRTSEVLRLIEGLENSGIVLVSEREGVDYSTPVGRLVTQILVSVAEMERAMIAERTRAGLRAAREQGRTGGRPRTYSKDQLNQSLVLLSQGLSSREVSSKTGISYSYLNFLRKRHSIPG